LTDTTKPAESTIALGKRLKAAREQAKLDQQQAAQELDVHSMTISRWERGVQAIRGEALAAVARLYGVPLDWLAEGTGKLPKRSVRPIGEKVSRETSGESWAPNPSLVGVVPQRVYEVAIGYCRRLAAAGLPVEDIEEAERLLIDEGYAKLNKRAKRVLTEDEQIEMIDATWRIMREALSWRGLRA
jgi:transcriptional regulator with XRE-family HTH domain